MGTDYFFRMGSTHAVCQDYAVAGVEEDLGYAILSDGCSGVPTPGKPGSPYTDFGARFLVRAAQRNVSQMWAGEFPAENITMYASAVARVLDMPDVALDATLLAGVTDGSRGRVFCTGDGVIAWKDLNGWIHYESISFPNGMPRYLSYSLNRKRHAALLDSPEPGSGTFDVSSNTFVPGKGWGSERTVRFPFEEQTSYDWRLLFHRRGLIASFPSLEADVVLLMSDGVESFQRRDGSTVPLSDVLEQLFDFKGFTGQFLVRRCTSFLKRFCAENDWVHADDLSVVAMHLDGSP